eukprot:TRINITY_DN5626_c0_g1_i2.p3 TRINITY_DN5626_c0_g1~~TRINITY_DN5626_c0_g1_i2.p3  ORF type:complete len:148 (-),score=4.42 TRINITY_DN5626_c0_g1_i2:313-756(-)
MRTERGRRLLPSGVSGQGTPPEANEDRPPGLLPCPEGQLLVGGVVLKAEPSRDLPVVGGDEEIPAVLALLAVAGHEGDPTVPRAEAAGEGLRVLRVVGEMRLDRRPIGNLRLGAELPAGGGVPVVAVRVAGGRAAVLPHPLLTFGRR